MGADPTVRSRLAEATVSGPRREINYSLALLDRDQHERTHIRHELARIKDTYGISNCTVLEAGCGLGHNLELFAPDNTLVGIDGLPEAVAQARMRGLDVREGNLEAELPLASDSIDWVLCLDVLEHLADPTRVLKEVHRILKVHGRVIINVPNHFDLTGRLKILAGHSLDVHGFFPDCREWNNPHLRFFTHRGIRQLMTESCLRIVDDRSGNFVAFPKRLILERMGLRPVLQRLARTWPALFAAGFFLIGEKSRQEIASGSPDRL
jgi:SAM-dependent methyltransferase